MMLTIFIELGTDTGHPSYTLGGCSNTDLHPQLYIHILLAFSLKTKKNFKIISYSFCQNSIYFLLL